MFKILLCAIEIKGSVWEQTFLHSQAREEKERIEQEGQRQRWAETETEPNRLQEAAHPNTCPHQLVQFCRSNWLTLNQWYPSQEYMLHVKKIKK